MRIGPFLLIPAILLGEEGALRCTERWVVWPKRRTSGNAVGVDANHLVRIAAAELACHPTTHIATVCAEARIPKPLAHELVPQARDLSICHRPARGAIGERETRQRRHDDVEGVCRIAAMA